MKRRREPRVRQLVGQRAPRERRRQGRRENRTVYRVTPYNLSGLADKDTGDAAGPE